MKPSDLFKASALIIAMGCLLACTEDDAAAAFVPLVAETASVRDMFARGDMAGGAPVVVVVGPIRHISDYRVGHGGETAVFPNAIEAQLTILAGERRGETLVFRGPLSDGLCGYDESDPSVSVCGQVNFVPDGMASGDIWALLTASQGGPELGSITTMAGRRLPAGTDPEVALADMTAFLSH